MNQLRRGERKALISEIQELRSFMEVNLNLKITFFGQLVFEMGKSAPPTEGPLTKPAPEEIRYREPTETAPGIYEIQYDWEPRNYIVPFSTA